MSVVAERVVSYHGFRWRCVYPAMLYPGLTTLTGLNAGNAFFGTNQLTGAVPDGLTGAFPMASTAWSGNCIVNATGRLAGCDLPDRPALVELFTATGGTGWLNRTLWLSGAVDACSGWVGVQCSAGRVTALSLPGNSLTGSLPASISAMSGLARLVLSGNQLSFLPDTMSSLTGLTSLAVDSNALGGTVPSGLTRLSALATLNLANNSFNGVIPTDIGNLTALR